MNCAVCGKDFGAGDSCQHCGAEKVIGLGNYNGYEAPANGINTPQNKQQTTTPPTAKTESTICYACGEIIPANSKFCPYCSKELYVTCPQCRHIYSSQYPACNACGTNRANFYEEQKRIALKKAEEQKRIALIQKQEEEAKKEAEQIRLQLKYDIGSLPRFVLPTIVPLIILVVNHDILKSEVLNVIAVAVLILSFFLDKLNL